MVNLLLSPRGELADHVTESERAVQTGARVLANEAADLAVPVGQRGLRLFVLRPHSRLNLLGAIREGLRVRLHGCSFRNCVKACDLPESRPRTRRRCAGTAT